MLPPRGSVSWYERFFDLMQRQKVDKVDKQFVRLNIVGSKNEVTVLNGVRFLRLINEDGSVTEKLKSLRVVGDEFTKNFRKVIEDAYKDLLDTIIIDAAKQENVINYFVQKYALSVDTAKLAAKNFINFAKKAGMSLSEDLLKAIKTEKPVTASVQRARSRQGAKKDKDEFSAGSGTGLTESTVATLVYDKIKIQIPKDDVEAALMAKRLIDMHIQNIKAKNGERKNA